MHVGWCGNRIDVRNELTCQVKMFMAKLLLLQVQRLKWFSSVAAAKEKAQELTQTNQHFLCCHAKSDFIKIQAYDISLDDHLYSLPLVSVGRREHTQKDLNI